MASCRVRANHVYYPSENRTIAHENAEEIGQPIDTGELTEKEIISAERNSGVISNMGSKPELNEASVASYNVACCYSKLNQVQAGLSVLQDAMRAGDEDFKLQTIRTDSDLANLRVSEEFEPENAINAIKSLFGIFKKE